MSKLLSDEGESKLEHKIARIASTFSEPNGGYKRTNGERNEEARHLKQDLRFKQIMQLITEYGDQREKAGRIDELKMLRRQLKALEVKSE